MLAVIVCLLCLIITCSQSISDPSKGEIVRVKTSQGTLFGKEIDAYDGIKGLIFLGIPYAEVPRGKLLFKRTVPLKQWEGELNATAYRDACPSNPKHTIRGPLMTMSDDCLHVNVIGNRHCLEKGACPVMVFVHGGRNLFLAPSTFTPNISIHNWASRDIVWVSIGYRLGIWGFFNLHPHVNSGFHYDANAGLWDLITGLKWVRKEIAAFGGNPKDITLFGHSSGGNLVDVLSQSPIASSLFNKQIMMSPPFVGEPSPSGSREITKIILKQLGCAKEDNDFVNPLRVAKVGKKDWKELLAAFMSTNDTMEDFWAVAVDGKIVLDTIHNRRRFQKPRPTMLGTVTKESRQTAFAQTEDGFPIEKRVRDLCSKFAAQLNYRKLTVVEDACVKQYMHKNMPRDMNDDIMYYSYASDIATVNALAGSFIYSFSYDRIGNASKYNHSVFDSPSHAEDFTYVLNLGYRPPFGMKDRKIEWVYTGFFTNFIKYGNPSAGTQYNWTKFNPEELNYFDIYFDDNFTMPQMREGYHRQAVEFWKKKTILLGSGRETRTDYPPRMDQFPVEAVSYAVSSHFTNNSALGFDKTLHAYRVLYKILTGYVVERKFKELKRIIPISRSVEFNTSSSQSNFPILLALALFGIALVSIGFVKLKEYDKRRNYQRI